MWQLAHVAGRALELVGVRGLDRVDEHHAGAQRAGVMGDRLQPRLAQHVHRAGIDRQPIGPQPDLIGRLLSGHVQCGNARLLEPRRALQQQGGLPDAGLAAHEHYGSRYDAAAEDEIELPEARLPPLHPGPLPQRGQADGRSGGRRARVPVRPTARPADRFLYEGIPRPARLAASAPLGLVRAAVGAAEHRASLSHGGPRGEIRAACSCRSACIPS